MARDSRNVAYCDACGEISFQKCVYISDKVDELPDGWVHNERFGDLCPDCAEVLLRVFERED